MFPSTRWTAIRDAGAEQPEALEAFATEYREPVVRYVRARGFNPADAENLCQEAFLRLLRGKVLIDPKNPQRIWVGISAVGTFRSDDGGETFVPKNAGIPHILEDKVHKDVGAFDAIRSAHPQLALHLFDEGRGLRQHVLCFHNDQNTRWLDDHAVDLSEGDRLTIIQAVSGG